ncbi:hypothetical protein ANO11243_020570 [Dothideomycetidae sp. 11243]|nr:hypothetical protein ANO11243_020570 [fungal sp. No.11243]
MLVDSTLDVACLASEEKVVALGSPAAFPETLPAQAPVVHLPTPSPRRLSPLSRTPSTISLPASVSSPIPIPGAAEKTAQDPSMPQSLSSYYGDSDYSSDNDSIYDSESIHESQCCQARAIRFLHPGKASVVDLMRAEKPVFKRASQVIVRRPIERPFISPIQPPTRYRRSSSASRDKVSVVEAPSTYHSRRRSSQSSVPTTPTLDDDEGSTSMASDASPSTPETPRSSFEQACRLFESYKESPQSVASDVPSVDTFKQKGRKPSRLRLFPKRAVTVNPGTEGEVLKATPQIPPLILETASKSTPEIFTMNTPRPWLTDVGARSPQLPPSPAPSNEQPLTARFLPSRSLWRDAGRPRFLRRVESRVGLNGAR